MLHGSGTALGSSAKLHVNHDVSKDSYREKWRESTIEFVTAPRCARCGAENRDGAKFRLALPSLVAQAVAPTVAAFLLVRRGGTSEVLRILAYAALLNVILMLALRFAARRPVRFRQPLNF